MTVSVRLCIRTTWAFGCFGHRSKSKIIMQCFYRRLFASVLRQVHSKTCLVAQFPLEAGEQVYLLPPHAVVAWCTSCGVFYGHGIQSHEAPAVHGTAGTQLVWVCSSLRLIVCMLKIYVKPHSNNNIVAGTP